MRIYDSESPLIVGLGGTDACTILLGISVGQSSGWVHGDKMLFYTLAKDLYM